MSGGSMNYLYSKVEYAEFRENTPERMAFRAYLMRVAQALKDIESVDSSDSKPGSENAAIMACVSKSEVLDASIERAKEQIAELQRLISP